MPRTPLEPRFTVEYLSILDAEGNLDSALDPGLPGAELKRLYRAVSRRRRRRDGVLRRRRDVRGRLPRGAQLRGRLARAGRLRVPEQPVGDLGAAQEADELQDHRAEGARLRPAGHPG